MAVTMNGQVLPAAPDYPVANAGWYAMHPFRKSNYGISNQIVGICLHSPEEPADGYESTPPFFKQSPAQNGSSGGTTYYLANEGYFVQMCRDRDTPHAQGVSSSGPRPNARLPRPRIWDPKYISYNCMFLSVEIEGYASTLHNTMPVGSKQYNALVQWIAYKCKQYNIPVDRDHILGHSELATDRTDPGPRFPWDALIRDVRAAMGQKAQTYVAQDGDTLGVIAGRLGVPVDALARVNNIANPNLIYVGQVLKIPGTEPDPEPEPDPTPDLPKHPSLSNDDITQIAVHLVDGGKLDGLKSKITDAKIEATSETSGRWEVHRLLVLRDN